MTDITDYRRVATGGTDMGISILSELPMPSPVDYETGFITRYFARQVNNRTASILEISQNTFNKIKNNPFYLTVDLTWKISGSNTDITDSNGIMTYIGISTANSRAIAIAEKTIPSLSKTLINVFQFWRGF